MLLTFEFSKYQRHVLHYMKCDKAKQEIKQIGSEMLILWSWLGLWMSLTTWLNNWVLSITYWGFVYHCHYGYLEHS